MTTKGKPEKEYVKRFGWQFRIQHGTLALSVIVLILTGIPLWFNLGKPGHIWLSQEEFGIFGDIEIYRQIHKIAGVVLTILAIYHLLYLALSREGRREFRELFPRIKDGIDLVQNMMYFFGLRKQRPKFGRFTYYEKFDYWAVYWGVVIMVGTGLALWFPEVPAKYFPWLTFGLALEVHADEALLAAMAIIIWHFYNVHYNPSRFPGTLLWYHGKISKDEMMHEHPLEFAEMVKAEIEEAEEEAEAAVDEE